MAQQVNQVSKASSMAARLEAAFEAWSSVDTSRTVFLGDLPENVNRSELLDILSRFGRVQKIVLPKEPKTKKFKGHGKAVFFDPEGAQGALAASTAVVSGHEFQIKNWVDPLTYIHQRDMKAHRKVYVKHKSIHTKESLIKYFQKFGPIEEIDMRFNFNSNRSRNFCYIVFSNSQAAHAAATTSHELMGQIILCEMCRPTDPLGTLTILPSEQNLDKQKDSTLQPEKIWHNIKQLNGVGRKVESDSLIWSQQIKKASKRQKAPYTCTELRQPAQNRQMYYNENFLQPLANVKHLTSLCNIQRRQKKQQIKCKQRLVYGCNHAESWFEPNLDLYRLPSIETKLDDHFTKPTSSRYSKQKTDTIELLHREDENIFFKRIRPSVMQRPQPPAASF